MALRRDDTPPNADEAIDALIALARDVLGEASDPAEAVGIGFGGPVDTVGGVVRQSFLSTGWENVALGQIVAQRLGLTAWLANDADAGGLGEAIFGAGRGTASLLYANVGTGIGGAVILDGGLYVGATSNAGEIGHMVLHQHGPRCECGKRGCLQALSSGTAIARNARELIRRIDARGPLSAVPADALTAWRVGEAALQGDELAIDIVREAAQWLGVGLANAAHLLDPERIVIGGGVADLGEIFFGPVRASYRAHFLGETTGTSIVPAELGYDAGVVGAAAVAMVGAGARSDP